MKNPLSVFTVTVSDCLKKCNFLKKIFSQPTEKLLWFGKQTLDVYLSSSLFITFYHF